jgi:type I restriction enzyme S subunit
MPDPIGRACIFPGDIRPCVTVVDVCIIRPDHSLVDNKWLLHLINSTYFRTSLQRYVKGTTRQRITKNNLNQIEILLPPLPEQKRIAEILDKADALRTKRREAIAKLDTLLQSLFLDMFGDPVTNPKGWKTGSIDLVVKERSDVRCGPFGTQLKVDELVDEGIPLYGIENVHNGQFKPKVNKFLTNAKAEELKSFDVKPGDVLVTRMGTIGRACVVPEEISDSRFSYHLFRIRPDRSKCLPGFLASTIARSGTFQSQLKTLAHGAIMSGLSTGNLREVKFLLPPVDEQAEYLKRILKIEEYLGLAEGGLQKLDMLFASLQHQLFSDTFPAVTYNSSSLPQPVGSKADGDSQQLCLLLDF